MTHFTTMASARHQHLRSTLFALVLLAHGAAQLSELPPWTEQVIIDVGANTDPILPALSDSATLTLAFEPVVHNEIRPSKQLMVVPAAVASADGLRTMGLYHHGMVSSSLSKVTMSDMPLVGTRAIAVLALGTVLRAVPPNVTIALLKTDIQGHDFEAISSVPRSLLRRAPYLKTEVFLHGHSSYNGVQNDFCNDFVPHLTRAGYQLAALVGLETRRATMRGNPQAEAFCSQNRARQQNLPGALAFEADAYWVLEGTAQPPPSAGWVPTGAFPRQAITMGQLPSRDAARTWMETAASGHCGATREGDEGDCSSGLVGSWALDTSITTWPAAVQQCLARCDACGRCRFVSLSLHLRDCSWYHSCRLNQVQPGPRGHRLLSGHAGQSHAKEPSSTVHTAGK